MIGTTFAVLGTAATLPGTLELALLTVGAFVPRKSRRASGAGLRRMVVVVPAHNEEGGVADCVTTLLGSDPPRAAFEVVVVADNCSDATAARARDAGARVLERSDAERRGKGFALEFAFEQVLRDDEVDAILVVDADTSVDRTFLRAAEEAFATGAGAVQSAYQIGNPEASDRVRLVAIAFKAFNVLRPRGRSRLGLSAGILGNGFGLSRQTVTRVPYTARSVVEDLEYHLSLVREGIRVEFLEGTEVRADQPVGDQGTETQRARWEGGRFRMMREHLPALVRDVAHGRWRSLEPLLELSLLPLAMHVGALGAILVIPFPPTQLYAAGGLAVVAAHVGASLLVGGSDAEDLKVLARVPKYIAWKIAMMPKLFEAARRSQAWVRTDREADQSV